MAGESNWQKTIHAREETVQDLEAEVAAAVGIGNPAVSRVVGVVPEVEVGAANGLVVVRIEMAARDLEAIQGHQQRRRNLLSGRGQDLKIASQHQRRIGTIKEQITKQMKKKMETFEILAAEVARHLPAVIVRSLVVVADPDQSLVPDPVLEAKVEESDHHWKVDEEVRISYFPGGTLIIDPVQFSDNLPKQMLLAYS